MGDEGRGHIKIGADFTDIVGMGAAISKALEDGRKGLRRGKTALLGYDTATNKAVATVKTLTEAGGLLTKHYTLATQKLVENSVASRTLTIKLDAQAKAQERLNTQMRSAYGSDVSRTRRLNLRAHAAGLKVIAERERALAAALRERIRLNLQAQRTGSRIIDARNRAQSGAILQDKQFNAQRDQRAFDQQLASEWKAPRQGVGLPTESRFKRALGSLRKWNTGLKTAQQTTSNLHISWKSLFRLVAVQLAHQAVSAFIRATVEGVRQSIELEKRIAEIQTISQNQPQPFGAWLRGLRELSDEFGLGIIDQAEAAYQTLSNQVAEGAASFRFMREANILAVTAVMSSADAVNLLTAAINSYHTTTLSANKIAAQFFKTIELGRVRGSEMAQSFGDVAVLANQLNVPLTELQAIIATMTIQGIKYNKAATQMRGIFVKLLKPTKEMKEFFKEIGVSSGEAAMAAYGFDGVMERLVKHTKGSSSELAKYISRIRGLSGTLVFNAEGMDLYKNNLLEIQSAQADYADRTAIVMDNAGKKLEIELNKIKNYFLVDFGDNILRTLAGVSGGFGNLTKIIKIAAFTFKSVLATAVIFALAQLVKLKAMLWSFASLNPMTAAVSLAVVALMFFYETWESASDRTNRIITENYEKNKKALEKMFTEEAELAAERETMLIDSFSKVQKAYILLFAEANMIINKIMKEHVNTFADATVLVNQNIKDSLAATKTHSAEVSKAYTAIENQVNKTNAAILGLQQNLEFDTITIRLKGMDAAGVQDLKNRLKDLGEEKADARPGKRGKRERERIKAEITEVQKLIRRGEQTNAAKKIRCLDTEITKQKELAAEHLKQAGIIKKGTEYDKEAIKEREQHFQLATRYYDNVSKLIKQQASLATKTGQNALDFEKALLALQQTRKQNLETLAAAQQKNSKKLHDLDKLHKQETTLTAKVTGFKLKDALAIENKVLRERALKAQRDNITKLAGVQLKLGQNNENVLFKLQSMNYELKIRKEIELQKLQEETGRKSLARLAEEKAAVRKQAKEVTDLRINMLTTLNALTSTTEDKWEAGSKTDVYSNINLIKKRSREEYDKINWDVANKAFSQYTRLIKNVRQAADKAKETGTLADKQQVITSLKQLHRGFATTDMTKKAIGVNIKALGGITPEEEEILTDAKGVSSGRVGYLKARMRTFTESAKSKEDIATFARELRNQVIDKFPTKKELQKSGVNIKEGRQSQNAIRIIARRLEKLSGFSLDTLNLKLAELINRENRLIDAFQKTKNIFTQSLQAIGGAQKNVKDGVVDIATTIANMAAIAKSITESIERLRKAEQNAPKAPAGKAAGGRTYALDTYNTRLSAGEFVMNREATSKFHSQLIAMNSGFQNIGPRGSVTNINGDFNISLEATGNTEVDVIALGKKLKHAIHTGRLVL